MNRPSSAIRSGSRCACGAALGAGSANRTYCNSCTMRRETRLTLAGGALLVLAAGAVSTYLRG